MVPALELLNDRSVDLILSDVCMTDGSGYEFIQSVKADRRLCRIPFVFITSTMLEEKDRAKGLAMGAARFLVRPIEPTEFLMELEACLLD
jgi:DNA-binding response OmpR family regulator